MTCVKYGRHVELNGSFDITCISLFTRNATEMSKIVSTNCDYSILRCGTSSIHNNVW